MCVCFVFLFFRWFQCVLYVGLISQARSARGVLVSDGADLHSSDSSPLRRYMPRRPAADESDGAYEGEQTAAKAAEETSK